MKNKWDTIYLLLRVFMGLVFIWTSWDKLLDPVAFARVVHNYQIIPSSMVNPYRGFDISCGCFSLGPEADNAMLHTLIRDIALLIPGLWLLFYNPKQTSILSRLCFTPKFFLKKCISAGKFFSSSQ